MTERTGNRPARPAATGVLAAAFALAAQGAPALTTGTYDASDVRADIAYSCKNLYGSASTTLRAECNVLTDPDDPASEVTTNQTSIDVETFAECGVSQEPDSARLRAYAGWIPHETTFPGSFTRVGIFLNSAGQGYWLGGQCTITNANGQEQTYPIGWKGQIDLSGTDADESLRNVDGELEGPSQE